MKSNRREFLKGMIAVPFLGFFAFAYKGNITKELNGILSNTLKRERIESDYHQLKNLLSEGSNASANAAKSIYEFTKSQWSMVNGQ